MSTPETCAREGQGKCSNILMSIRIIDGREALLCSAHAMSFDIEQGRTVPGGPLRPTDAEREAEEKLLRDRWNASQEILPPHQRRSWDDLCRAEEERRDPRPQAARLAPEGRPVMSKRKHKRRGRLDWNDREAVRKWWAALIESYEDISDVADDATLPLRKRKLGPAAARRIFRDADDSVRSLLSYGEPIFPPDNGDPAGNGGSPAE